MREGSIPLQTETIVGKAMRDFILRANTGKDLEEYQKEFCRTALLIENMKRRKKIKLPEEGKDLIWNGSFFEVERDIAFKWNLKDEFGEEIYYLPIEYLPRPLN